MQRPRTFTDSLRIDDGMNAPGDIMGGGMRRSVMASPYGKSSIAFLIAFAGLSMAPGAWPFEKVYSITRGGRVDPKRKAVVSSLVAVIVFYLSQYIR